jgi:molybdate transport system substrate-binding protein
MRLKVLLAGCALSLIAFRAEAAQVQVAVAANFTEPAREIAALFKRKTGNDALLSFGASGVFYAQISHGAPFQILLSADQERPKQAVENGYGVPGSRFTYAIGKLALWSKVIDVSKGDEALKSGAISKLSIANPKSAPYGAAAIETMKALGVYDKLEPKIVQGTSIAQAFEFVDTKNAEAGFVALSQLYRMKEGTRWVVPAQLYAPIRQDAVLLKNAERDEAAQAFLAFLKGPEARAIVERFGYALP